MDPQLRVSHLKRWTVASLIASDVVDRGIPWTQLIWRIGHTHNELNLRAVYRVSVVLSYACVTSFAVGFVEPVSGGERC